MKEKKSASVFLGIFLTIVVLTCKAEIRKINIKSGAFQYNLGISGEAIEGSVVQLTTENHFWEVNWDEATNSNVATAFVFGQQNGGRTKVLDEDTASHVVALWGDANQQNQKWHLERRGTSNMYHIINRSTMRCLRADLQQQAMTAPCDHSGSDVLQFWEVYAFDEDFPQKFILQSKQFQMNLGVSGTATEGSRVELVTGNEFWEVNWNDQINKESTFVYGRQVGGRINVLDEDRQSHSVAIWGNAGLINQKWFLRHISNNYYQVVNGATGWCLRASTGTEANTTPCDASGSEDSQNWVIKEYEDPSNPGVCSSEVNAARQSNGISPAEINTQVEAAAKLHNDWMIANDCFSHQCPGEMTLGDRLISTGYQFRGVGEILVIRQSCQEAVNAWLESPGHRGIILGDYRHFGCSGGSSYWTCVFAIPVSKR